MWLKIVPLLCLAVCINAQDRDCSLPADLFFVIDGSESVSDTDFKATKEFVTEVLADFDVSKGNVHVGANVFGTNVYDRVKLHGPSRAMYILFKKRIETLTRVKNSGTYTFKAIEEMRNDFDTEGRDVTKVGIVITDGKSINFTRTSEQAALARAEGVNMIAIGVAQDFRQIFRPELENIASSNSTVFMTKDVSGLSSIIREAIKDFTCITKTTAAPPTQKPTTPNSSGLNNNFDCPDCMIDDGHGFWKHPHSCEKYIEIIADANGNRTYLSRKCRDGLFWDQYYTTCRRPEDVQCDIDPCSTLPIISYDVEDLCGAYIICVNGRSRRACCPINERYVAGQGCVQDVTCIDACDGTDDVHLHAPSECNKVPHPTDSRKYIESPGEGHADVIRPCPAGTLFNKDNCMCDIHDDAPGSSNLADCNPTASFTFDNGATDMSGEHAYAGTELVDFVGGQAVFSGNGMVNIYRFSMDDFAEGLVLRMKITPSSAGSNDQALVTNCVYSTEQRSSVSIRLVRSDTNNYVVFSTDTTLETKTVTVNFTPDAVNDITYIYDGANLIGIVNGVKQTTPLNGRILMRRSGMILGAGSQLDYYTGTFDEFQLYKCFPAFAESERTP